MRYRTAVKTGRTAALQLEALAARSSFTDYVAMVERRSGYLRPLHLRGPAPKRSP